MPALAPPPERIRSASLQKRLARLRSAQEAAQYQALVGDVTRAERAERGKERFGTYRQQLGFGVHVLVMMGTGYAFGYTVSRSFGSSLAVVRACACQPRRQRCPPHHVSLNARPPF